MDVSKLLNGPCPTYASVVHSSIAGSDAFHNEKEENHLEAHQCQIGQRYAARFLVTLFYGVGPYKWWEQHLILTQGIFSKQEICPE